MTCPENLITAARALFSRDVGLACQDPRLPAPPLWPGETLHAAPRRTTEFAAGRNAARQALRALGQPQAAIPIAPDRSPVWPCGIVGSISHSATACLVAVAHGPHLLGIDLEPATPLEPDLWETILRPEDHINLASSANPALTAKLIFSAKETAYKAQYPRSKTLFGFETLSVTLTQFGFTARFMQDIPGFSRGSVLTGSHTLCQGHFITAICT